MPITTTSFNSFMAKKKPRSSTDELAVVKAAAWAWYQRGSGSEGKPMGDFDVARTRRVVYRPSRYKLEAMRISEQEEAQAAAAAEDSISIDNTNHSLLDRYEIESISKRFDQLINSSTATKLLKNASQSGQRTNGLTMNKKKSKILKGFWPRHAVVCGTRQDAVMDPRIYGVSRQPEKRAPMVKLATCRPRLTHA